MRLARWLRQPQTNKKTQSVLGQLPTANQAPSEPAQRCGPAGPPRPPERVRKYWLAGKPEALVISPHPRARMRARPGSHFLHPVIQWGRGAAHPTQPGPRRSGASPRRACVLGWPGRFEAGRRDRVFGFFFFLCSRPCSSHLPRTGARLSLGLLGVCDWPGPRSSQLSEAWRRAAWRVGSEASLWQWGARGGHAAAGSAETAASASGYGRSPRRPGDPGRLVGFWNLPAPGGWGRGPWEEDGSEAGGRPASGPARGRGGWEGEGRAPGLARPGGRLGPLITRSWSLGAAEGQITRLEERGLRRPGAFGPSTSRAVESWVSRSRQRKRGSRRPGAFGT